MNTKTELTGEVIKDRLVFVLKNIIDACKKYDLKYYVYGGTLLGTVRHQGFIPWDDDIDICMPRPDYDRLFDALAENSDVTVFNCEQNVEYTHTYTKVSDNSTVISMLGSKDSGMMGVNIDVFPLDALGDTFETAKKRMSRLVIKRSIATMSNLSSYMRGRSNNIAVKMARSISFIASRFLSSNRIHVFINQEARKMKFDSYKYIGSLVDATYREREIYKREWFGNGIEADFEGLKVIIPDNAHNILTQLYGNYLVLPPKEKRIPIHEYKAYFK